MNLLKRKGDSPRQIAIPADLLNVTEEFKASIPAFRKDDLKVICGRLGLVDRGTVQSLKLRISEFYASRKQEGKSQERDPGALTKSELPQEGDPEASTKSELPQEGDPEASTKPGASSTQRKQRKLTHPAEIAPHSYHADLFQANFPLVEVQKVSLELPVQNKFDRLLKNFPKKAHREWIRRLFEVKQMYQTAETEDQCAPFHLAFFEGLKQFSRPSKTEVADQNDVLYEKFWDYEEITKALRKPSKSKGVMSEQDEDEAGPSSKRHKVSEEFEDCYVSLGENNDRLSDGDYSELSFGLETFPGALKESEDTATGFADGAVHVTKEAIVHVTKEATGPDGLSINCDIVAAILERKFAEDKHKWNARFQGGFYAAKFCLVNLRKGNGNAIYVIVMTKTSWNYGILCPDGYVRVGPDGKLVPSSYNEFLRHLEVARRDQVRDEEEHVSFEQLEERLAAGTEFYRENYKDNPGATYVAGPMLVGRFFLSSNWYALPHTDVGASNARDGLRFFSGLMRIALGDSVCDWTEEDFEKRMEVRKTFLDQKLERW